jgi:hypothetical protein
MTFDDLVTQTKTQSTSDEPLDLLASASHRQQELADLGDLLLDHFVQEARAAGCSWSQIGTALGVSKQAAQQRHSALRSFMNRFVSGVASVSGGMFTRFTPQARRAVVLAQEEARLLHHGHLGTEHLLLGLLAEGEGLGAQALHSAGITLEATRARIEEIVGAGEKTPRTHIPFTPRAKEVLGLALRQALELGHNYIGTEHLLLGLLRDGEGDEGDERSIVGQVLAAADAQPDQLRDTVLGLLKQAEKAEK